MAHFKKIFVFLIIFTVISCGKNKETEEHQLEQQKEPDYEQAIDTTPEPKKSNITYESAEDSIRAGRRKRRRNI